MGIEVDNQPSCTDVPQEVKASALADELLPMVYEELRRISRGERRRIHAGETLQTTAVIHEAYLKLRSREKFCDQQHFLRSAATAMRHVLINHLRESLAAKRGGGAVHVDLAVVPDLALPDEQLVLEIDDALQRLARISPRLAQVVECRYFGGYDERETAMALGLNERTVRRDWTKARAWLRCELGDVAISGNDRGQVLQ